MQGYGIIIRRITNVPRRYANLVYREGFEGLENLSDEAKGYIAPLPLKYDPELPGYKKMLEMASHMGEGMNAANLPKAQENHSNFIISHIPEGIETILDVGCGTGGLASELI